MTPYSRLAALGVLLPALLVAAPKPADSAHYRTVRDRVGEGGQVFVYVDIDGYFAELGRDLTTSIATAAGDDASLANWKQDYAAIAAELGLSQVKAVGLSARPLADGLFANRAFLYAPEGRRGLLQVSGSAAHSFASARLAPADADLFIETELDLAALCGVSLQLCKRISPELAAAFPGQTPSSDELPGAATLLSLTQFKGRFTAIMRLSKEEPAALTFDLNHDMLLAADAHGPQFIALLQLRYPDLKIAKKEGERAFYARGEKAGGLSAPLAIATEGERLYVASSEAFLRECLDRKTGLPQAPAFNQALAATTKEGNTLAYASPRFFTTIRELLANLPGYHHTDRFAASGLKQALARLERVKTPVVLVVANQADGVLVQSVSPESLREALPLLGLATPDLAGNILRAALPAYVSDQYARGAAERQAVAIRGNLGKLSAVADLWFTQNPDSDEVSFPQLQELDAERTKLVPVAAEDYSTVTIHRHRDAIEVETPEDGAVTGGRPLTPDEQHRIEANLALFDEAAAFYFSSKPDETTMTTYEAYSAGGTLTEAPAAVVGEDYDFSISRDSTVIELRTPGGNTVSVPRDPGIRWTALKRKARQSAAIRENLAILYSIATDYLANHPDESYVSGSELFGEGKERPEFRSIAGESYDDVRVTRTRSTATVSVPHLGDILYEAPLAKADATAIQANLRTIAGAAKTYFGANPKEELAVVGELVGNGKPLAAAPEARLGEDYLPLVIERSATKLSIVLPSAQTVAIEVP